MIIFLIDARSVEIPQFSMPKAMKWENLYYLKLTFFQKHYLKIVILKKRTVACGLSVLKTVCIIIIANIFQYQYLDNTSGKI